MSEPRQNDNIDLTPIVKEAQPIVREAVKVYLRHLQQWYIGIIIHGSAFKGGFISGCSDIDLQIYLQPDIFNSDGDLPLELCMALHRDLAAIDPAPFQYIQGYPRLPHPKKGFVGLIPGAYHVITGTLPVPEATEEELQISARHSLSTLTISKVFQAGDLLQHGSWKLAQRVRWLCTDVWPTLYHVLTIQQNQGIFVWQQPKQKAMQLLPYKSDLSKTIQAFYQAVCSYYQTDNSVDEALHTIQSGLAFLQATKFWWNEEQLSM